MVARGYGENGGGREVDVATKGHLDMTRGHLVVTEVTSVFTVSMSVLYPCCDIVP